MKDVETKGIVDDLIKKMVSIFNISVVHTLVREDISKSYSEGMTESEVKFDMNFNPDPRKIAFLEEYTFDNIKGMNEDIANKLRGELQRGLLNMESISALKKRVKKVMDISIERARMIARTEMNRAANAGSLDGARQSSLKLMKRWDAHLDNRTSPICNHLDGQTVPLDGKFKWNGKEFDAPPAHPNCRSTLLFIEEGMEDVGLKHKYIKRTGGPGNYKYWYKDPKTGKITSSDDSKESTSKKEKKDFIGTCDRVRQTEEGEKFWQNMMKNKKEISEKDFLKNVKIKDVLDEGETWSEYKETLNDEIKFFKSKDTYFFQTSGTNGFEFIWTDEFKIKKKSVSELDGDLKHKYIKRTGGPGNYKYWYKDPKTGKLTSNNKPKKTDKVDEKDRLFYRGTAQSGKSIKESFGKGEGVFVSSKKETAEHFANVRDNTKQGTVHKIVYPYKPKLADMHKENMYSHIMYKEIEKAHPELKGTDKWKQVGFDESSAKTDALGIQVIGTAYSKELSEVIRKRGFDGLQTKKAEYFLIPPAKGDKK